MRIDRIAESSKENCKNTENKLHQMFYDYFGITAGVVIERAIELKGEINQNKDQEQLLQSYLMTKTKSAS